MKAIEAPKSIEPWRIICAAQSEPDYSEERYMLIYAGDGSDDYYDKGYILLEGWHCSCYDWPEVDWDATYYEEDELLKIADMRKRNPFFTCYPREFWKDNKKCIGEVCEKCRDEIDYSNVREEQK
ncbi:MAG: hypothetical protein ACLRS5_00785 [Collinsella sp.]